MILTPFLGENITTKCTTKRGNQYFGHRHHCTNRSQQITEAYICHIQNL